MNEITFSNYKFTFTLNTPNLNIKIQNIINQNLFENNFNDQNVKSITDFYKLIKNALKNRENFNITIHEEEDLIKVIINYDAVFINLKDFIIFNKIDNNLQNKIDNLEKNIAMLISHNNLLEQKVKLLEPLLDNETVQININPCNELPIYKQIYKNNVDLVFTIECCQIIPKTGYYSENYIGEFFYHLTPIFFSKNDITFHHLPYENLQLDITNFMLTLNFNSITITFLNENYVNKKKYNLTQDNTIIADFLQMYSNVNKHVINKIIIDGTNNKNKMKTDIIEKIDGLTNYKELHL